VLQVPHALSLALIRIAVRELLAKQQQQQRSEQEPTAA